MSNFESKYCKICGEYFIPTGRNNTVCGNPICQKKRKQINREDYLERQKDKKTKAMFLSNGSLNEISKKAREAGMSYGKYVLMMQQKVM